MHNINPGDFNWPTYPIDTTDKWPPKNTQPFISDFAHGAVTSSDLHLTQKMFDAAKIAYTTEAHIIQCDKLGYQDTLTALTIGQPYVQFIFNSNGTLVAVQ